KGDAAMSPSRLRKSVLKGSSFLNPLILALSRMGEGIFSRMTLFLLPLHYHGNGLLDQVILCLRHKLFATYGFLSRNIFNHHFNRLDGIPSYFFEAFAKTSKQVACDLLRGCVYDGQQTHILSWKGKKSAILAVDRHLGHIFFDP